MTPETAPIASLHQDPANVRKHSERNLASIKASLARFGQQKPVVVGKNNVVLAGNGTLAAAMSLGWTEIQIVRTTLAGTEATAYAIADNRTAELAEWDDQALAETLRSLQSEDFDLDAVGFTSEEVDKLIEGLGNEVLAAAGEASEDGGGEVDRADELQTKWKTLEGQLWVIPSKTGKGEHRLLCGDSTKAEDVARVMDGKTAELSFTSPPYSDQREYAGGDLSPKYLSQIFSRNPNVKHWIVNLGLKYENHEVSSYWDTWIASARDSGLKLLSWNVWDRINATSVGAQRSMFARQHEWLFCFGVEPKDLNRTWEKSESSKQRSASYRVNEKGQKVTTRRMSDGSVKESTIGEEFENKQLGTVLTVHAEMSRTITDHPAPFPVALPAIHIEAMTSLGDAVYEPFCGSGTTIVAAEQLGRICHAIELAPKYVAVILERLTKMGLEPYLGDVTNA